MDKATLLLSVIMTTWMVVDAGSYAFTPSFDPYFILEGDSLHMICEYKHDSATKTNGNIKLQRVTSSGVTQDITTGSSRTTEGVKDGVFASTIELVKTASTSDSGKYRCSFTGDSASYQIDIMVLSVMSPKQVEYNSSAVVLKSDLSGLNNTYTGMWTKNGATLSGDKFTKDGNTLTINKPDYEDLGIYNYTYTFGTNQQLSNAVYFIGPPVIDEKAFGKSRNVVQKDTLTLTCPVSGFPTPSVTWKKDDSVLSKGMDGIGIADDKGIQGAQLKVYELVFEDAGEYKCEAHNSFPFEPFTNKTAVAIVTIRVKDRLAALWPFLGIVAEVVILCVIILIYERRRSKQMQAEADSPDYSANTKESRGDEVRQRNVRT